MRRRVVLSVLALSIAPGAALAGGNDFRLNAQRNGQGVLFLQNGASFQPNAAAWESFTTELAYVMSPRLASPAETLGYAGFHVGAAWSGTLVHSDDGFWGVTERAQSTGKPNGLLQTLQLDVRKGLPFSFELGVNFLWLVESELFAPGLEVRWALHEGFRYAPDIGIRGSVNQLVGSRDLNLTVIGLDLVISHNWGIAGMMNLAPYLSYSTLMVAASSRIVDPTPTDEADVGKNFVFPELTPGNNIHHKLTIGARAVFYILYLSVQGEFQIFHTPPGGNLEVFGGVATVSTKLGLEY